MERVMICQEISSDENETYYYAIPDEWEEVQEKQFIYIINKKTKRREKQEISIFQIIEIYNTISFSQEINIIELSEDESIHLVSEEFFLNPSKEIIEEHYNDPIKELREFVNILIKNLEDEMSLARIPPLNDERKEYLLKMFCNDTIDQFNKRSERVKKRWFDVFNNYELICIHMINLYNLKENIKQLIDENEVIDNNSKEDLEKEYMNKIDIIIPSLIYKGNVSYQMDEYIGIKTSSDGKDIVLGEMSPLEFYFNIFSFWNIVKNLLTVSFIPILVVLLDSNKKIIIYCLLSIVYIVPLVLSDENQTDRILTFLNQIESNRKRKISYGDLFSYGITVILFFAIFSVQIIYFPDITDNIWSCAMYLVGDVLFAYTILFLILAFASLFFCGITIIASTITYIKRAKVLSTIFSFGFSIIFWGVSNICLFYLLGIYQHLYSNQILSLNLLVFLVAFFTSTLKIIGNILEKKKEIKINNLKTKKDV